ncbi:hypothetical protein [Botrimarina hoheduenensis]|uniref:DUF4148 domain-containing protein n=1 Tax=Botrimarina hoheduenensis TaxID=2528000 RepID=A0A5C5VTA0_9BACT|nr:hypothetical protein [Botrimarina hoheduenensis]TWT41530.1 hypothetical protein Pla111_29070 [Botrimarina hoheduenensis]
MNVRYSAQLLLAVLALTVSSLATAQDMALDGESVPAEQRQSGWDYEQSVAPSTPTQIIQQKAQSRGAQRASRIAAQEWYGYSQARPRTNATPFSGMYGTHFNGSVFGRPAAHYATRPIIIVNK